MIVCLSNKFIVHFTAKSINRFISLSIHQSTTLFIDYPVNRTIGQFLN
jgi:hypothetical protein